MYGGLIHEDPSLLAAMSAAVDFVNKRRRRIPSTDDERVRALENAYGTRPNVRVIPYKPPAGPHSVEELEPQAGERKLVLVRATGAGKANPKNRPGRRNDLGKRWSEGDILNAVFGKAVDFNGALHEQALHRALALKDKLRIAVKMLKLKEAA